MVEGKLILYDVKTVNSRAFTWAKKTGNPMSHYHRMQLGTYMYMLRHTKPIPLVDKLEEARILKISKDDLRMSEQQLFWTPDLEKEVVGYWRTLQGYWDNKKLPRCTCADHENGFMAREAYNPYFFKEQPCSIQYLKLFPELVDKWRKEIT